ncbi:L,D-peptidoglycan transpeptidase YkuD (ErfK/YbiS/YcfS/YnhG family) [Kaistia dalseonensis]|uniref:L,D-peptidoglycan transpeptidase YkuD (ErfK/YbiS/YcfS/YnhG family) n=1 Tax=Kaistia dalseonensis TaxID=410840 RepID=A0ABU0H526_9HYPH|nr:L,D-peptidoglycan transpeptidase YkuD (ErfK/YbiS/YcfS/YnhG family) [Kaistia dalseonensis]
MTIIEVRSRPGSRTRGLLRIGQAVYPCALGRSGLTHGKREGDGGTPASRMRVVEIRYRPDRVARPRSLLPTRPLRADDGWCDQVWDANYNRPVKLPYRASHEAMWRADHLYDVVVVLDWNLSRRAQGRGSAIFFHLARPGFSPTEGCVAVRKADMLAILRRLRPGAIVSVA